MQNILQTNHKSNQPQPNQGNFQQNGGPGGQKKQFKWEDWQTEKKGESIQREGRTWWWCPQHNEGKGLYVRHKPENHGKWLASKNGGPPFREQD